MTSPKDTSPTSPSPGSPLWLRVARVAWVVVAGICVSALLLLTAFSVDYIGSNPAFVFRSAASELGVSRSFLTAYNILLTLISALIFIVVGVLMVARKPKDTGVLLYSMFLLVFGSAVSMSYNPAWYGVLDMRTHTGIFTLMPPLVWTTILMGWMMLGLFMLTFPNGRIQPRAAALLLLLFVPYIFTYVFPIDSPVHPDNWSPLLNIVSMVVIWGAIIAVQVYRYRRVYTPVQRQQTKWFVLGILIIALLTTILGVMPSIFAQGESEAAAALVASMIAALQPLVFALIPITIAFAVLRYRLWDIDFLINRSLIYGGLAALLAITFLAVVAVLSVVTQGQQNSIVVAVALVVCGALFQPALRFFRGLVDRKLYHIEIDYRHPRPNTPLSARPAVTDRTSVLKTTHFGAYRDWELVGKGGMAEVYRATHPTLDQPVAIKILPQQFSDHADFQRRFQREGQIVASLQHPNIVRVFDSGEFEGQYYMVMEYVAGQDLGDYLHITKRVALEQALPMLRGVASALDYAHARGLIHRDVKPSNILLARDGNGERALLTDFGIAKSVGGRTAATATGVIGTFDYMSPEQIQELKDIDGRADVYAFGVMTYQLLTGELPFKHQNVGALLIAHLTQPAPDPREIVPDLPRSAAHTIRKALAKSREERYQTARAFVADLERASDSVPIAASPV